MKKYKLIKQYPTSPKLGFIVAQKPCGIYYNMETGIHYGSAMLKNYPEFWEEVVEKDYEILSQTSVRVCNPKDNYKVVRNTTPVIHSVKRLSDGEVFTVGDTIRIYEHGPIETIETITTNSIRSSIKQGVWFTYNSGSSHMDHAIKQKQPIYLTHDGKDIFVGDRILWVNKDSLLHGDFTADYGSLFLSDQVAYFLSAVDAQDYIIENKPALSIKEFWEITTMSGSNRVKSIVLEELVTKRLNLK